MLSRFTRAVAVGVGTVLAIGSVAFASVAHAEEVNVIDDPALRQCIATYMHYAGIGYSPGHPDYATEANSISQEDLDALAGGTLVLTGNQVSGWIVLVGVSVR